MAEIYLIRHAQASFGTSDYDRLSELGNRQAEVLGQFLNSCAIQFDAVYCGELRRQQETARIALEQLPQKVQHQPDPRLNEIESDKMFAQLVPQLASINPELETLVAEGKSSSKQFQKALEIVFNQWVATDDEYAGLQSWADYSADAAAVLGEIVAREGSGKTVGVFTSGGTIATIVAHVLGATGEQVYKLYEPLINCSVTRLLYSGSRISLSSFNDHVFIRSLAEKSGEPLLTYR